MGLQSTSPTIELYIMLTSSTMVLQIYVGRSVTVRIMARVALAVSEMLQSISSLWSVCSDHVNMKLRGCERRLV